MSWSSRSAARVGGVGLRPPARRAVRSASVEAFQQTGTRYLEQARSQLETTVAPLRESLQRVGNSVQELDRARAQSYGALRQQVELLSERTGSLANALRQPHVRGRWGVSQLRTSSARRMLEALRLRRADPTRDRRRRPARPDLIVRVPGGNPSPSTQVPLSSYLTL